MALIRIDGVAEPRDRATVEFLFGWLGHRPLFDGDGGATALGPIRYGDGGEASDLRIARAPAGRLIRPEVLDPTSAARLVGRRILAEDVIASTGRLLADDGVAVGEPGDQLDVHGRLRHSSSLAASEMVLDRPVVDLTVDLLGRWLQRHLGVDAAPRWPQGARAVVGLSHDVDHPDPYATLLAVSSNPLRLRNAPRTLAMRGLRQAAARWRDPERRASWTFRRVVDMEARHGFRSSWFFASMPFFGPWGTPLDVAYDIADGRFRGVFDLLRDVGADIGLHTGYAGHRAASRIRAERIRLADLSRAEVAGNRHHYWHLGPAPEATLRAHEAAGFAYDSSIAFNDAPGLRRLVSLPFRPFDATLGRPLRTIQLPVLCMDGALFGRSTDVDAALRRFDHALAGVIAAGGVAVLDWHAEASVRRSGALGAWGEAYQEILALLAARRDLWVTDLHALASWAGGRIGSPGDGAGPSLGSTP